MRTRFFFILRAVRWHNHDVNRVDDDRVDDDDNDDDDSNDDDERNDDDSMLWLNPYKFISIKHNKDVLRYLWA